RSLVETLVQRILEQEAPSSSVVESRDDDDAPSPPAFSSSSSPPPPPPLFLPSRRRTLSLLRRSLAAGHGVLVCGERGVGKTTLLRALGVPFSTLHVFADMTSRDLLQRRVTGRSGATLWRDSPLVAAMREGGLFVLDG